MSFLTSEGIAHVIRHEYAELRKALATLRPPRDNKSPWPAQHPALCRRCGCDIASCREYGCTPPDDTPQTTASLTGNDPGMRTLRTHYTDGSLP